MKVDKCNVSLSTKLRGRLLVTCRQDSGGRDGGDMELTSGPSLSLLNLPQHLLALLKCHRAGPRSLFFVLVWDFLISPPSLFDNLYLCFSVNNSRDGTKI